jgi:hypothetical protein
MERRDSTTPKTKPKNAVVLFPKDNKKAKNLSKPGSQR